MKTILLIGLLALLPRPLQAQGTIQVGQTVRAELTATDPLGPQGGFSDLWSFPARAGRAYQVTARLEAPTSPSPITSLYMIVGPRNLEVMCRGTIDDCDFEAQSTQAPNASVTTRYDRQAAGTLYVLVTTTDEREMGRYTLTVTEVGASSEPPPPTPAPTAPRAPAPTAGGGTVAGKGPKPAPGGAPASSGPVAIAVDQTVRGELTTSDLKLDDDSRYDMYALQGRAGERYVITLRSSAFDTYLAVGTGSIAAFAVAASDDDGGGGTDSRVEHVMSANGTLLIRANSLDAGETGSYSLSVERASSASANPATATPTAIRVDQEVRGELTGTDLRAPDDSRYDLYAFQGTTGETYVIEMRSGAFDTYLDVGVGTALDFTSLDTDDDGAGDTDSRVEIRMPSGGTLLIRANSLGSDETGAYTLVVRRGGAGGARPAPAPTPTASPTAIAVGQTVRGELTRSDLKLDDDTYYDPYVIQGAVGDRYTVTMRSSAFDAWLSVGTGTLADFQTVDFDDDSGGGTDSQIEVQLREPRLIIRANAVSTSAAGAYTLTVTRAGASAPAPAPRPSTPAPSTPAPQPAPASVIDISICVVQERQLSVIIAQYNRATGDTLTNGRRFRDVYGAAAGYAADARWFINNETITVNGRRYQKYGLPRVLGVTDVTPRGVFEGVGVFAEAGVGAPPEIVYVPVRPGCEFQPYQVTP